MIYKNFIPGSVTRDQLSTILAECPYNASASEPDRDGIIVVSFSVPNASTLEDEEASVDRWLDDSGLDQAVFTFPNPPN